MTRNSINRNQKSCLQTKMRKAFMCSDQVAYESNVLISLFSDTNIVSLIVRKPAFCICENKDADQLRSNCAADLRLCFRYTDSTIPLLPKSEITNIQPFPVAVQTALCRTWSETLKTGFLTTRLKSYRSTFLH